MRKLWAGLVAAALVAAGFVGVTPAASAATTWTFPDGTYFTLHDAYDGSQTADVYIQRLSIAEGGATTGYVRVETHYPRGYTCSTQVFSGTAAQFFPASYSPCSGSITFAVDPATGALSASSSLVVTSLFFNGAASGSVTAQPPTSVTLPNCTLSYDAAGRILEFAWPGSTDADSWDLDFRGSAQLAYRGWSSNHGPEAAQIDLAILPLTPTPNSPLSITLSITGKRSDGATVAKCDTNAVDVPGLYAPTVAKTVPVAAGGLLTVNYDVIDSPVLEGVEYRIDNGPWLRPGGTAPVNGVGGSFTVSGITAKSVSLTLRSVGTANTSAATVEGAPTTVTFPAAPSGKPPASSGVATGSTPSAPVAAAPAQPTSTVSGTSNGAGGGTNGALAATTGDAGVDAPCLAKNGTLYPTLYSTVGSQLTMAPNTAGMGDPTAFTVVGGALPAGIQLDRTFGVIFGVPTQAGAWTTTVQAKFADGSTKETRFGTRIDADPQTLQYAPLSVGFLNSSLVIAPSTNAPATGTTYRLVCGTLPKGTRLDTRTGRVLGKPAEEMSSPVPLRIAETSATGAAAASFLFVVVAEGAPQMNYPAHPHVRVGKRVTIRPSISGVDDIAVYRTSKGKLPRGLHLNGRTGDITGRVLHAGKAHTVTIVAETASGRLLTSAPMKLSVRK